MEQYILKSALLAEFNRLIAELVEKGEDTMFEQGRISAFEDAKLFLDTLEVKEVDLDALGVLANHLIACNAHGVTPKYSDRELDFLEGLANNKVQKGE